MVAVSVAVALGAFALAGPAQASTNLPAKHVPSAVRSMGAHTGKSPAVTLGPAAAAAKPKGYVVVHSGALTSPAGAQAHGSVSCPAKKVPLGGGVFFSSGSVLANINSSYPTATGWSADVNNASTSASSFTVYAACSTKPGKYAQVLGTAATVNAGTQLSNITATCATGSRPLGGGLFSNSTSTSANVNSSIPTATGWRIDANDASATAETVTTYLVCGKVTKYHMVAGTSAANNSGTQTGSTAACGHGVPIGGGAFSSSGSTSVSLNTTLPVTNGWESYQNNNSTSPASITPYTVCSG
jgi:hypothetical protein